MSETKIYGLLGEKLGHSYSPQIHAHLGEYEYRLFERAEEDVPAFLNSGEFEAINVTIPYKKTVMPYLAEISDEAIKIGSVNTITRVENGLRGDNTDYYGFSYMLAESGIDVRGKKCLVLGSGGASVTAQAVLADLGAIPVVISRGGENNYDNLDRHADASVIVNTTPVGMYPKNGVSPIDLSLFPALTGVVDMIYNPRRTALILQAKDRGIPAVSGLSMLVAQAKRANELFFARPLPDTVTEEVIRKTRRQMDNVILSGMPGCGKSTAGMRLAERLGFDFADTDEEIVQMTGRTPAEIIKAEGEDTFRKIEHDAACALGKRSHTVIATGGGIVTRAENRDPLRQNGTVIYLTRPLEKLATGGRPLTAKNGVQALFDTRRPLYESWADACAVCKDDTEETLQNLLAAIDAAKE
ncbi:MAG: shikimate kinase [Clostridia bacterium]|nr:shikimate kinase [Clostridia bacterium]